ncbi:hypothetical protein H4R34_002358 [Dimargaris verticillata]|uniref:WD40-repeat-containing domain protein n=1 Tax=Dimargaris verticillata TaxID=2761393 RepID=A0A9W8E9D4_9FUNG|nr:hypothetical protein H4R34_002358 [Dimargaris verticillata]
MAGLRRLSVKPVATDQQLPLTQAAHWRMNLCAITQRQPLPLLFIALEAKIHVYPLVTDRAIPAQPFRTLWVPTDITRREQPNDPSHADDTINAIKIAPLDNTEVLVAVNDQGFVCLWQLSNLQEPWLILDNEVSTWGVDIHTERRLLAVSNNDHNILVAELPTTKDHGLPSELPSRLPGEQMRLIRPDNCYVDAKRCCGHTHNVPYVTFSPCGRYLASGSIDEECRIWDVATGNTVRKTKIQGRWGWSVQFVDPFYFKTVPDIGPFMRSQVSVIEMATRWADRMDLLANGAIENGAEPAHAELHVIEESSATDSEDGMVFEELEPDHFLWRRRSSITHSLSASSDHSDESGLYSPGWLIGRNNASMSQSHHNDADRSDMDITEEAARLAGVYGYGDGPDENLRSDTGSESPRVTSGSVSQSSLPSVLVAGSATDQLPSTVESTSLADVTIGLLEGRPLSLEEHQGSSASAVLPDHLNPVDSSDMLGLQDRPWMLLHGNTRGLSLLSTQPSFPVIYSDDFIVARSYANQYIIPSSYWRLNMVEWIPELGVAIVACQMGKLALVRLMKDSAPAATTHYTCYVEQYLPAEDDAAPHQRLLGFCVSRRECHDPQLRRYLVYLIYTDGTYFIYELGQAFSPLTAPLYNLL